MDPPLQKPAEKTREILNLLNNKVPSPRRPMPRKRASGPVALALGSMSTVFETDI